MKDKGDILARTLMNFKECYFFLHNTKDFNIVEKIMNEGFLFENQLPHSTDRINPRQTIEITYFLFQRKDYGPYTIIIAIPKNTYEIYSRISNNYNIAIEDILTIAEPYSGDNDEPVYKLSPHHILGYFDINSSDFIQNKNWDPSFNNYHQRNPGKRFNTDI